MNTTPPPMPEAKHYFCFYDEGGLQETDEMGYSLEDMQTRDAQWMERITALESDRTLLRGALLTFQHRLRQLSFKDDSITQALEQISIALEKTK